MERAKTRKRGLFYGYWIAIATAVITTVQSGSGVFAFSLFIRPFQTDFGWSRGEIMVGFTIFYVLIGIASPFIGRLVDRFDARKVIFTGALVAGLGFLLISRVSTLWQFYAGYGIVGIGIAGIGYVPASAVISRWFKKRRGTAIGIMSVGMGAGGIALAPLLGSYIIPGLGRSAAYVFLAVVVYAVVMPLALFVVKARPSDKGLYPDGANAHDAAIASGASSLATETRITPRMALGMPAFWMIIVSFLASNFCQGGILQTQVPFLQDNGFSIEVAAGSLGVLSVTSAIGKVIFGWLCDRISPKYACLIGLFLQVGGLLVLFNVGAASPVTMVWLYAVLYGFGIGSWLPTMSMLTSTTFGLVSYGAIFGVVALAQSLGVAFGPLMAGYIYDANGSYYWAIVVYLALYGVAIPSLAALRRPKTR